MSLCRDCFHSGNHIAEGHDYNMFKSQAGGACDCGDASVMRTSGFCCKVNISNRKRKGSVELLCSMHRKFSLDQNQASYPVVGSGSGYPGGCRLLDFCFCRISGLGPNTY